MRGKSLLLATVFALSAAVAVPAPAAAQSYQGQYAQQDPMCRQQKAQRMVVGGILGAIAGAVLGNNVASRNAQPEGSMLGGVLGGATGAAIGNATSRCGPYNGQFHPGSNVGTSQYPAQPGYYPPQGGQQPYGQPPYDDYGLEGGPSPSSYGRADNCRYGEQVLRDPYGRETRQEVYMCQGRDGVWRVQS